MNELDRELMERYIYEVIRRLPSDQRGDVGLELQGLIGDMLEEGRGIEDVLTELGDPAEFAKRYQDDSHYLIGPAYYDTYLQVLKIVVLCSVIASAAVTLVQGINTMVDTVPFGETFAQFAEMVGELIAGAVSTGIASFGSVTLVFALMDRRKIKLDTKDNGPWKVTDLMTAEHTGRKNRHWSAERFPSISDKRALVSRGECIAGIIFTLLFCVAFTVVPFYFSAYVTHQQDNVCGTTSIHFFNLDAWGIILPFLLTSLLIGLAEEIVKLVNGVYNRVVMITAIVCGTVQIVLSTIILKVFDFWNPNFISTLESISNPLSEETKQMWLQFDPVMASNGILTIIILATLLEVGTTIYKTLRYGVDK